MSRIGVLPVSIPTGVTLETQGNTVSAKGPKGELSVQIPPQITFIQNEDNIVIEREGDDREARAYHGLARMLVYNTVHGVSEGFEKRLQIIGVGYRAELQGSDLKVSVGYSHPVIIKPEDGISFEVEQEKKSTIVVVKGVDKQRVGQIAADIRAIRKPEPYKGKGIRYMGEYVRIKQGKSAGKK